jgi:hypothetical protein
MDMCLEHLQQPDCLNYIYVLGEKLFTLYCSLYGHFLGFLQKA